MIESQHLFCKFKTSFALRNEAPTLITVICYFAGINCLILLHCFSVYRDFLILLAIFFIFRRKTFSLTCENVIGKSKFDFRNYKSLRDMSIFIIGACILPHCSEFALIPLYPLSDPAFFYDCLVGPFREEAVSRGVLMTAILRAFPNQYWKPILMNTALWISSHNLITHDVVGLFLFGTLSGICFKRFNSVPCCAVIHSLWNFV